MAQVEKAFRSRPLVVGAGITEEQVRKELELRGTPELIQNPRCSSEKEADRQGELIIVPSKEPGLFKAVLRRGYELVFTDRFGLGGKPLGDNQKHWLKSMIDQMVKRQVQETHEHEIAHQQALPGRYSEGDVAFGVRFRTDVMKCPGYKGYK